MTMNRPRASLAAALALLVVQPAGLVAQTVPLNFQPPDMVVAPVCVARSSDAELIAEWGAWDGAKLPDRDVGLIKRDMRGLAGIDAVAWDDTIQKVIALLPSISSSFTEDQVTLARIERMIAQGKLQQLRSEGLVQQLLDRGAENSPNMLNALAGFVTNGIGIDRDTKRGAELLMAAAYGGNADALLTLSHQAVAGNAPEDWDLHPELAVTLAFGSLIGQVDPQICDRIARIAREFSSGEVVSLDHDLAVRWYRLAADLGDPVSAWRVAEYEMQSELVTKDNDVLITYLTKAADGNLPYAQVALGRVYETNALVPVDLAKAQTLYEAAAASGDRAGLIRLSGFLESQLDRQPALKPEFLETLVRLENLEVPPSWVFAKRAAHILADRGRWIGQADAIPLLERGAALDDPVAIVMLARINLGTARTDAAFYGAVDDLAHAVTTLGEAAPTAELQAAYMCKAPAAPLLKEAAYWADVEAAIGSSSLEYTDAALAQLAEDPDPLAMATLQTEALYGRATPLANLLEVLKRDGSPASEVAFWTAYAGQFSEVETARAALALDQAENRYERVAALDMFRAAIEAGENGASLKLAKALLRDDTDAARTEAAALLLPLARDGNGAAMALLPGADPVTYPTTRTVFEAFSGPIDERGDFLAMMLAIPFAKDAVDRETYRARAMTAMACDFPEALAFADTMATIGDPDEARRWLAIATQLVEQEGWQLVQLGDGYRSFGGSDSGPAALAYYEKAQALGNQTAVRRLLDVYDDPTQADYDQDKVVSLFTELVMLSSAAQLPSVLEELSRQDESLRLAIEARLDVDQLYAQSAEAGHPVAMREYARLLRADAVTRADIEASTGWLVRASEGGDVPAMVMLAQAYSMGVGVPTSIDNARLWLEKAAEAGDRAAIDMVKLFTINTGGNQ